MPSLEKSAESAEILLLQAQADLTAAQIKHGDTDTPSGELAKKDRIVVTAMPREIEVPGHDSGNPKVWRIPVRVEIILATANEATMDTYLAAIEAANNTAPSAPVLASVQAAMPTLYKIENTDEGERTNEDDQRIRAKTYNFIVNAS